MSRRFLAILSALVLATVTLAAQIVVIVANVAPASSASGQVSPSLWLAAKFTSPTAATTISTVSLPLEAGSGAPAVSLALFSDVGGLPGASLASLGTQVVTVQQAYTFTPPAQVDMAGATPYWLVLTCQNCVPSGQVPGITNNWGTSASAIAGGLSGVSVGAGLGVSSNSGATWGILSAPQTFRFTINGQQQIVVPTVPEVVMIAMLVVTVLGGAMLIWRRHAIS